MDNSVLLSTNDTEIVTMGNILSSTNETNAQTPEINTNNEADDFEVKNPPNPAEAESISSTANTVLDTTTNTKIDNSDAKKESLQVTNIEPSSTEPVASSSQESTGEEHMEIWFDGKTRELVKDDIEEDFDVIVKSLETAIVETERYEPELIQEPVITSVTAVASDHSPPIPSLVDIMDQDGPVERIVELPDNDNEAAEIDTVDRSALLISGQPLRRFASAPVPQIDCVPNTDELDDDYVDQSTSLFETQVEELIDVPPRQISVLEYQIATIASDLTDAHQSLRPHSSSEMISENIATTTSIDIDPEISESSIVSASTEDNDESMLLNTTVESSESDFTLQLEFEEETETINTLSDKQDDAVKPQELQAEKIAEKNPDLNDIKIIGVTTIVDYDDSSEEEDPPQSEIPNNLNPVENTGVVTILDSVGENKNTLKEEIVLETDNKNDNINTSKNNSELVETIPVKKEDEDLNKSISSIESYKKDENTEIKTETKTNIETSEIILKEKIEILESVKPVESKTEITENQSVEILNIDSKKDVVEPITKETAEIQKLETKTDEEPEEKSRTPPKKIKLIRQKLPSPLVKIKTKIETAPSKEITEPEKNNVIEIKNIQESIKSKLTEETPAKSDMKIQENVESDEKLFSDIFKIEEEKEVENKPVKIQKLKLKRNYQSPPLVRKVQVQDCPTKKPETVQHSVKITEKSVESKKVNIENIQQTVSSSIISEENKEVPKINEKINEVNIVKESCVIPEILNKTKVPEKSEIPKEEIIQKDAVDPVIAEINPVEEIKTDTNPESQENISEPAITITKEDIVPEKIAVEDKKVDQIQEENINIIQTSSNEIKPEIINIESKEVLEKSDIQKINTEIIPENTINESVNENIEIPKIDEIVVTEKLQELMIPESIKTTKILNTEKDLKISEPKESVSRNIEIIKKVPNKVIPGIENLKSNVTIVPEIEKLKAADIQIFPKIEETKNPEQFPKKEVIFEREKVTSKLEDLLVLKPVKRPIEIELNTPKYESNKNKPSPQFICVNEDKKKTENIEVKKYTAPTTSVEKEKIEPEVKKISEIQFPLLMSRLQDKLHANLTKTNRNFEVKTEKPMIRPQIELQRSDKYNVDLHKTEAETSSSKIRALKRKHETELTAAAAAGRSVTKPLTVEIDDLESSDAIMQPTEHENIPKLVIKQIPKPEQRSSPKITIKPIKPPGSPEVSSKRSKLSEDSPNTPRITIKPLIKPDALKITITKQKSDDTHSILKIYQPGEDMQMDESHVPKLTIKSISKNEEMQHSPKITIKPVKPPGSPKVTVKPVLPPSSDPNIEHVHSPKMSMKSVINPEETYPKVTIKPVLKPEETHKVTQISPRQVKLKSMTFDSSSGVTVEAVCGTSSSSIHNEEHENPMKISVKPFAKMEETSSPKLTIKPITKTCEIVQSEDGTANPLKLTIKPILKPEESYQSPKITIKPIVKPDDYEHTVIEETDKPERIILKIQKTNLPSPKERTSTTHVRKESDMKIEAIPPSYNPENMQKLDKIKLKFTKEGNHAEIIPSITTSHATTETNTSFSLKRSLPITNSGLPDKRAKSEFSELLHSSDISINIVEPHSRHSVKQFSEEVTIMKIDKTPGTSAAAPVESMTQLRLKEMLLKISQKPDITCTPHMKQTQQQREDSSSSDDVRIVEVIEDPLRDPLNDDSSSQDVLIINEVIDTNPFKNVQIINAQTIVEPPPQQYTPKKRGRPRKVPLEVRPEIKGEDCILSDMNLSAGESPEGGRPKRMCRAPAGRTPFAVKERKPRGSGRGRGSSRGARGAKALNSQKIPKEPKISRSKALKEAKALAKLEAAKLAQEVIIDAITIEDSTNDTLGNTSMSHADNYLKKPEVSVEMVEPYKNEMGEMSEAKNASMTDMKNTSVSVYEEETRMSASENNSRAQTPARQVFIVPLSAEGPDESQSSVQSSATTESTKNKKGRLEICDHDSAHTTVEQIVEYAWGNGGPYMLQEQIAQYLGVKSFKRKYPGLTRRPVDMQERDYIKEKGLVSESMCDMGLTAVPSSEILDIMYSDFQEKYEEYRKCLRDKQSKEISNKQKAISLATSQEKNKLDFKERAIRSTANWNATFNKMRNDSRKCCMDLQTFTVNYPTGKNFPRVPHKNPVGSYPIALVPGQFTDYYKAYSNAELNYLPLNTVRYGPVLPNQRCLDAGLSDGSSESDSSSGSDSDSSDESMSTDDEAPSTPIPKHLPHLIHTTPKTKVH